MTSLILAIAMACQPTNSVYMKDSAKECRKEISKCILDRVNKKGPSGFSFMESYDVAALNCFAGAK